MTNKLIMFMFAQEFMQLVRYFQDYLQIFRTVWKLNEVYIQIHHWTLIQSDKVC